MIDAIRRGETRAVARAATLIENGRAGSWLAELRSLPVSAWVVGITGPPGAGKSTLVDRMAREFRAAGKTVGILAVDPTSPKTGGAILGDRIRMQALAGDPGVFIRSMATRGSLGGLAQATEDMVALLAAAGRDVVLIETVGVGQSEVSVASLAAVTVVVLAPGMGDDVQALKAGILEIADVFAINKADHEGAAGLRQDLMSFASVPVIETVATEGKGVRELIEAIRGCVPGGQRPEAGARRRDSTSGFAIDHLGVAVRSIEAALGFYRDRLGMGEPRRETVDQEQVHVAMLAAGGPRIELLEPASEDSVIARFIAKRGEGLHHVALRVRDFEATIERLRSGGARLLNEPRAGAGGHLYVFVHPASTGGVLLEIIKDEEHDS